MTSRFLILNQNHSTYIKLNKLVDLADELGISMYFSGRKIIINDSDRDPNLAPFELLDIEDGQMVNEFPPTMEFKIRYENPEYLAEQERLNKIEDDLREKKKLVEDNLRIKKLQLEESAKANAIKVKELKLLSELKAKYESV